MTLMFRRALFATLLLMAVGLSFAVRAQGSPPASAGSTLFQNVRIFDGKSVSLSVPSNVLVKDNLIERISTAPIAADPGVTVVAGGGRTLMPGLIDVHWHAMLARASPAQSFGDVGYNNLVAGDEATDTLRRGFTTIRDVGGPVFGLKSAIDEGIDLCLSVFPWAHFRTTKAAVKMHTLLDLRGSIPAFIHISDGKLHDVNVLDLLLAEPGAIYVMDRGYVDFARLNVLHQAGAFFITRAKSNMQARRLYSAPSDRSKGIICDQTIALTGIHTSLLYPEHLRRIRFKDAETGKMLVFITNQRTLPAETICALYKCRWQVELFFKWIKQHLRIKRFYGTSENAVKTQIWVAVSVYVLVAIVKKRLDLDASLYTLLQILSLTLFEKIPILQALSQKQPSPEQEQNGNQLNLFES